MLHALPNGIIKKKKKKFRQKNATKKVDKSLNIL